MFSLSDIIIGLADKLCGQTGVTPITFKFGVIIGPPADNEYAVDPVGVLNIIPSLI